MGFIQCLASCMARIRQKGLRKQLDSVNSDIKDHLIPIYGSWENVPDWRKK